MGSIQGGGNGWEEVRRGLGGGRKEEEVMWDERDLKRSVRWRWFGNIQEVGKGFSEVVRGLGRRGGISR